MAKFWRMIRRLRPTAAQTEVLATVKFPCC